jgi:GTPase SAR1 family protein
MGVCATHQDISLSPSARSREIDRCIRKDALKREIKVLLLGPGESGKTTVFKQLKILQDNGGYTDDERKGFMPIIHFNCVSQMVDLLVAAQRFEVQFLNEDTQVLAERVLSLGSINILTEEIAKIIEKIWSDEALKDLYQKAGKTFPMNDTANYFFDNLERFFQPDYIPSIDDILRVRVRSTGIEEADFNLKGTVFKFIDVGGQRSERRKWIHCFDSVTAILFCASLIGYDQVLREDNKTNTMKEALNLFDAVVNDDLFHNSTIILFLNKTDLFHEKIAQVNLNQCFIEYSGGADYDKASQFIASRFLELRANDVHVFVHFTCAIDTDNISHVINDVKLHILTKNINGFFGA